MLKFLYENQTFITQEHPCRLLDKKSEKLTRKAADGLPEWKESFDLTHRHIGHIVLKSNILCAYVLNFETHLLVRNFYFIQIFHRFVAVQQSANHHNERSGKNDKKQHPFVERFDALPFRDFVKQQHRDEAARDVE